MPSFYSRPTWTPLSETSQCAPYIMGSYTNRPNTIVSSMSVINTQINDPAGIRISDLLLRTLRMQLSMEIVIN